MKTGPRLSMLWESVDPERALADRFGFVDTAGVVAWLSDILRKHWAIAVDDCDRLVLSDKNLLAWMAGTNGPLIVKCCATSARFARLADSTALVCWLHERGIPVATPIAALDGRLRVELDNASVEVSPVIGGDLLDVADWAHVEQAGRTLATLHHALAAYPRSIGGAHPTGARQLVHNDFRSANILHDRLRITAVLDFDEVTYRTKVADLAQAAVLLATRYHHWSPTSPAVREAFIAAYHDEAPLTDAEHNQLQRGITAVMEHFGWT